MIKGEPTQQRVSWFHQRNTENNLILAPPFQRKPVWSVRSKSYLIDTIIRGLPVPEIYMQIKTDEKGRTKYIVVDGQQRMRAILEFLNGEFIIEEEDNITYGNKYFEDLPDGIKKEFWDYTIVVRELTTSSDEDIRGIFQRLNKYVVPLNKQELRNATYMGHFIKLMKVLSEDTFWAENKIMSPNDIRRMLDAEFISELFIAMIHGIQTKNPDVIDGFYKQYDDSFPNKEEWIKKYRRILDLIEDILPNIKSTRWSNKADFYSLFLTIQELNEQYLIPADRYNNILENLNEFDKEITTNGENSKDSLIKEYYEAISKHTTDKENRKKRHNVIRQLLIPYLIAKDQTRKFTEEERRVLWVISKEKICGICRKEVKWVDYEIDHKIAHNKGGKTELMNAQITHKSCNSSKSDK